MTTRKQSSFSRRHPGRSHLPDVGLADVSLPWVAQTEAIRLLADLIAAAHDCRATGVGSLRSFKRPTANKDRYVGHLGYFVSFSRFINSCICGPSLVCALVLYFFHLWQIFGNLRYIIWYSSLNNVSSWKYILYLWPILRTLSACKICYASLTQFWCILALLASLISSTLIPLIREHEHQILSTAHPPYIRGI